MVQQYEVLNPVDLDFIASLDVPDQTEIDKAIVSSVKAFKTWSRQSLTKRQGYLIQISASLESNQYAKMSTGKETIKDDDLMRVSVTSEPFGVCALVLPWNYPIGLLSWKLAPCLLAGNTAVVKPSPHAPLTVLKAVELVNSILPEYVVQSLPGGDGTGRYLVSHRDVEKVSLTGSQETGKEVFRAVSNQMPALSLELGGNDAAIILQDCDLEKRFDSIFWGAFANAGQICISIKRLYVPESLLERVVELFSKKIETLKIGNGLDDGVEMGPLNNKEQLDRVTMLVEDARKRGASVVCGGERYDDHRSTGYFYKPTIVTNIDDSAPLVAEEQFGPALPILTYTDVDEAIDRANDTSYGLGGSIWTENIQRGQELASRMQCGTVWLNAHMLLEHDAPFGGWKQSGIGRELGRPGLEEFLQTRTFIWKKG